jgi:predicted metal-binding transcription factor (methanogenesis marker protein 9)
MSCLHNKSNKVPLADVLKSISDNRSLSIFQLIGDASSDRGIILRKLGLSRNQYYRISAMLATDLIRREKRRYYLTPFGKVIYCCIMIAKSALNNHYKLKAVELAAESKRFSNEELNKLVNALIDHQQIKEFVTEKC